MNDELNSTETSMQANSIEEIVTASAENITVTIESADIAKRFVSYPQTISCEKGSPITCTALPHQGYLVDYWWADIIGKLRSDNEIVISPVISTKVKAYFKAKPITITVKSENENMGTVSGGGTTTVNVPVQISAVPKQGYAFEGWYLNGVKLTTVKQNDNYYSNSDSTLIAKFVEGYKVTVESENTAMGTVSGGGSVIKGWPIRIIATPKPNCKFIGWFLDGEKLNLGATADYTPTRDCRLIAKFSDALIKIEVQSEDTSKGTASYNPYYSNFGLHESTVSLRAEEKSGFLFEGWYLNGTTKIEGLGALDKYTSQVDCTLVARFKPAGKEITTIYVRNIDAYNRVKATVISGSIYSYIQITGSAWCDFEDAPGTNNGDIDNFCINLNPGDTEGYFDFTRNNGTPVYITSNLLGVGMIPNADNFAQYKLML